MTITQLNEAQVETARLRRKAQFHAGAGDQVPELPTQAALKLQLWQALERGARDEAVAHNENLNQLKKRLTDLTQAIERAKGHSIYLHPKTENREHREQIAAAQRDAEIEKLQLDLTNTQRKFDALQERFDLLAKGRKYHARLIREVEKWLDGFRGERHHTLVDVPRPAIPDDETIEAVRADIETIKTEIKELELAPLTKKEAETALDEKIAAWASGYAPQVTNTPGGLVISHRNSNPDHAEAFYHPAELKKKLLAQISKFGTVPAEQKLAQREKLQDELLPLERLEAAIIERNGGQHRAGIDIRALLSIGWAHEA